MFSVIIPLYNKELSIFNTIQSVLDQTFQEFEIVVINDGSNDNSAKIVENIGDSRIQLIHQENQGVSAARNKGIEEAKNEWIAFLDGDDLWMENHLEILSKMIVNFPKDKVFCTSYVTSNETMPEDNEHKVKIIEDYFSETLKYGSFFWTSVACFNHDIFEKVGHFNIQLNRGEDLDLWTRIARQYRFIRSLRVTAIYRLDAENRSDKNFNLIQSRVYNYDFAGAVTESEIKYYQHQISKTLRAFLSKKDLNNFIKLYFKHKKYISLKSILKR